MKKKPKPEWTEARLLRLLERRYAGSAWALLRHVRSGTGAIDPRTVDAMAMSLWPSRGLHLYGFEIKVSTTDWLRELREPQKAEDIFKFCDFWYIVGAPGAVNREKLPKTWGLLEPDGKGNLRTTVEAPPLKPKPMDRVFLAALLRKVSQNMPADAKVKEARQEGFREGEKEGERNAQGSVRIAERERDRLEKRVREFEEASGLTIDTWDSSWDIGKAVRAVLDGEAQKIRERLERIKTELQGLVERCDESMKKLPDK